jgi:hypothetical protein
MDGGSERARHALLNPLFGRCIDDDAVHINARQVDMVRIKIASRDDLLDFRDGDFAGHGRIGIEIPRGPSKDQITRMIGHLGFNQRYIGDEATLHNVSFTVKFLEFLALGHDGTNPGAGVERRDACSAGAQALSEGTLRGEFKLEFACEKLPLELFVLAHITGNHAADLARG